MYSALESRRAVVRLSVTNGIQTVYTTCQELPVNYFHGPGHSNLDIAGDKVFNGEFNIKIPNRIEPNLKTTLTVDTKNKCTV